METRLDFPLANDGFQRDRSDTRRILTSLGEIAYEWSLAGDDLIWGANFADVLGLEPEGRFATGAQWESACLPIEGSRASAIAQAQESNSHGAYSLRYRVRAGDGAQSFIVDDSGRWFAGADGRPARAHGLVRVSAAQSQSSGPGARVLDQARFMETLARACAAGGRENFALLLLSASEKHIADLQKVMRAGDVIAVRDDGALALLLRHCDAQQGAQAFQRFAKAFAAAGMLSGGGAIGGHDCAGARTLMRRAEQALATCSPSTPLVVRAESATCSDDKHRAVCEEIVAALDEDRVFIALQPIVDAQTGAPALYEALVRIRTSAGTITGPGDILGAAEESGLVADLDQRVLELALAYLSANSASHNDARTTLSVNVLGASLRDPAWPDRVEAALMGRETLARQLVLEITETVAIIDLGASARALNRLRALGCRIAMDDFGAGHTSFRNLRALEIDIVKIDGAFVRNLVDSEEDQFFVRTLHELAKRIGARTVAEWVENAPCAALLAQWGVDYLQGAHYGMPVDIMPKDVLPVDILQVDLRHDLEVGRQ